MQKACLQVLFQKVKNKENHSLSVSGGFNLGHCQKHVRQVLALIVFLEDLSGSYRICGLNNLSVWHFPKFSDLFVSVFRQ